MRDMIRCDVICWLVSLLIAWLRDNLCHLFTLFVNSAFYVFVELLQGETANHNMLGDDSNSFLPPNVVIPPVSETHVMFCR